MAIDHDALRTAKAALHLAKALYSIRLASAILEQNTENHAPLGNLRELEQNLARVQTTLVIPGETTPRND